MKTIEKTVEISKAISEVWIWKDEVYRDIKHMSFKVKAAKILKGKLKTNSDGSCSIVKV